MLRQGPQRFFYIPWTAFKIMALAKFSKFRIICIRLQICFHRVNQGGLNLVFPFQGDHDLLVDRVFGDDVMDHHRILLPLPPEPGLVCGIAQGSR